MSFNVNASQVTGQNLENIDVSQRIYQGISIDRKSFFAARNYCDERWQWWAHLSSSMNNDSNKMFEVIKRILIFIPLVIASVVSYLIAAIGYIIPETTIVTNTNNSFIFGNAPVIMGSGVRSERSLDLSHDIIQRIEFSAIGTLHITQSPRQSLIVAADDNLQNLLYNQVANNTLILGIKPTFSIQTQTPIDYQLSLPPRMLSQLEVLGTGKVTIDHLEPPPAPSEKEYDFSCRISGSGEVECIQGKINSQKIIISAAGSYKASNVPTVNTDIAISDAGKIEICVNGQLTGKISDAGTCTYYGNPSVQPHIDISEAGRVIRG